MSKASYWQRGETIDYVNSGTDVIEADTIIVIGSRLGIAGTNIASGEKGSLHVTGIFEMPKGNEEITVGTEVYYSEDDGVITASADGNVRAGFAILNAASGDTSVLVKINA